jgi:hypothetical protein
MAPSYRVCFDISYCIVNCFCVPEIPVKTTTVLPKTEHFLSSGPNDEFIVLFPIRFK